MHCILIFIYLQNLEEPKLHLVQTTYFIYVNFFFTKNYRYFYKLHIRTVLNGLNVHYATSTKSKKIRL